MKKNCPLTCEDSLGDYLIWTIESSNNSANYTTAVQAIGGKDNLVTRVFGISNQSSTFFGK